jgi:hypothetical protein
VQPPVGCGQSVTEDVAGVGDAGKRRHSVLVMHDGPQRGFLYLCKPSLYELQQNAQTVSDLTPARPGSKRPEFSTNRAVFWNGLKSLYCVGRHQISDLSEPKTTLSRSGLEDGLRFEPRSSDDDVAQWFVPVTSFFLAHLMSQLERTNTDKCPSPLRLASRLDIPNSGLLQQLENAACTLHNCGTSPCALAPIIDQGWRSRKK